MRLLDAEILSDMNRAAKRQVVAMCVVTAIALTTLVSIGSFIWLASRVVANLDQNCADMPPPQVFQRVFERAAPSGLSDIRGAGRIYMGGRDIYLRFRATDAAIQRLTRGTQRVMDAKQCIENISMDYWVQGDRRLGRWKERVRWDEVVRIPKPECYDVLLHAPASTPDITLVIDRGHHLVYVRLFDI